VRTEFPRFTEDVFKPDAPPYTNGGHPTELQLATIAAMEAAGAYCCIDEGLNCALPVPETWGLLRGHAITADKSLSR
jgi:hypothetical protein